MPICTHTHRQTGTNTARQTDRHGTWLKYFWHLQNSYWQLRNGNSGTKILRLNLKRLAFSMGVCVQVPVCVSCVCVCALACVSVLECVPVPVPQALRARLCGIREIFDSYFNEIMQAHFHTLKAENLHPCLCFVSPLYFTGFFCVLPVTRSYSCRLATCESGLITCTIAIASGVHDFVDLISSHGAGTLQMCVCVPVGS